MLENRAALLMSYSYDDANIPWAVRHETSIPGVIHLRGGTVDLFISAHAVVPLPPRKWRQQISMERRTL